MSCRLCGSETSQFNSEITIHYSGMKNIDNPGVMLFPQVTVCLQCGVAEFTVPKDEVHLLEERGKSTAA